MPNSSVPANRSARSAAASSPCVIMHAGASGVPHDLRDEGLQLGAGARVGVVLDPAAGPVEQVGAVGVVHER